MVLILLFIINLFSQCFCEINLYIGHFEVQRVLGFNAELYYIRQGIENWNAIEYNLMIPETIDHVKFRWQGPATKSSPLVRSSITTQNGHVLDNVQLSLPPEIRIPSEEKEFQINMTCKQKIDDEALVNMFLNISNIPNHPQLGNNAAVNLKFSFNKLCKHISIVNEDEDTTDYNHLMSKNKDDDSGPFNKTNIFYIAVGIAFTTILVIASAVGLLHVHSMPKPIAEDAKVLVANEEQPKEDEIVNKIIPQAIKVVIAEQRQKELMGLLKDYIIPQNLLSIGNTVQEGSFGRAYLGNLINAENGEELKVLVKTVTDQASPEQKTLFLAESCYLKRVTHHNVSPLMHVCFDELKPPLVIYQYMNRGNLKNYLRLSRTAEPLLKPLTTRDIVLMALQIARGCQHLHRRRIIHKDVATRNCVVDEELHVKICDNALARDFFPGDYHCLGDNENRPIRWMSVDSLENGSFSPLSDVWSFGVLLWELCSLAQTPYANVDPFEMLSYLNSGLRLPQPMNCPDDFFTVMACCWALSPEERPHFTQIIACLEAFFNKLNAFI